MEASIKDINIKHFVRLLQCASRFGDDLHIHANKELWEMAVTNSTKSAFCLFKLNPAFFCRYKAHGENNVDKRRGVKCSLLVKSVLAVLGKASSLSSVQRVDLTIVDPGQALRKKRKRSESDTPQGDEDDNRDESDDDVREGIEAKLILKLVCKHGITKKHSLHLGTSQFLRAEVDPNSTPSSFSVSARTLRDMLDHFSFSAPNFANTTGFRGENQLGWMFGENEVRLKSWEMGQSSLSTEIKLDPYGEFVNYGLHEVRVDLTVPMKEFRAALTLAEQLSIQLMIAFSVPTQPLTIIGPVDDEGQAVTELYEIFCAIATTSCEAFSNVSLVASADRKASRSTSQSAQPSGARNTESQRSRTSRSRLSLTTETRGTSAHVVVNTTSGSFEDAAQGNDPLFLPAGSQPEFSGSHHIRASQREVMEMAGLDDVDEDELLGGLEDLDEEDQREEELSTQQRIEGQGGNRLDGTLNGISSIAGNKDTEAEFSLDFEPNGVLLGNDTSHNDEDGPHEDIDGTEHHGRVEGNVETEEDDMEETQTPSHNEFTSLFDD